MLVVMGAGEAHYLKESLILLGNFASTYYTLMVSFSSLYFDSLNNLAVYNEQIKSMLIGILSLSLECFLSCKYCACDQKPCHDMEKIVCTWLLVPYCSYMSMI